MTPQLPESSDGLPNFCGAKEQVEAALKSSRGKRLFLPESRIDFGRIRSAFANALHMHQPLMPAGGSNSLSTFNCRRNVELPPPGAGLPLSVPSSWPTVNE